MKSFTEESLNELQQEIVLPRVLEALGYKKNFDTPVYDCPFCSQETCLVLNSEDTKYYCFECEAKGDAISLVMSGWNQSFNDAVKFLSIMFNCKVELCEKKDVPIKKNSPSYCIPLVSEEETLKYTQILDFLQKAHKKKGYYDKITYKDKIPKWGDIY